MAFQFVHPRDNDALQSNPPAGDVHITTHASDWLWAVFAIMLLSWFTTLVWLFADRKHRRIFHYIPVFVLAVSTVAYFAMASDLGWTLIRSEFDGHPSRQIWYARYIQWFINAPLVLLALLSFTHLATPQILSILFFSWYLVVDGLIGALVPSSYKWGFFVFGLFGLFFIWVQMLLYIPFQHGAFEAGNFKTNFIVGAAYISFIWMLYPICWGLSEGSSTISPTSEMVFYGILDIMSAPVFLLGFMAFVTGLDEQQLRTTAFGTTDRGEEQQQPASKQQRPLEAGGAQQGGNNAPLGQQGQGPPLAA